MSEIPENLLSKLCGRQDLWGNLLSAFFHRISEDWWLEKALNLESGDPFLVPRSYATVGKKDLPPLTFHFSTGKMGPIHLENLLLLNAGHSC